MFNWICATAGRAAILGLIVGLGIGGAVGFGLGVYFLPILTAGPGLDQAAVQALATSAERRGRFVRDLPGSDALHWGDDTIMMNANKIWLMTQFRLALITTCISRRHLLMMAWAFWRSRLDHGKQARRRPLKILPWIYRQLLILVNMMRW